MTTRAPIATTLAAAFLALFGVAAAPAGAAPDDKVTICHATADVDNPYVKITVNESSLDGEGKNDHQSHTGSLYNFSDPEANEGWGDIIPPSDGVDPLNWDEAGQAIHANGCNGPEQGSCPDGSQPVEGQCSTEETCPSGEPAEGGECSEEELCELDETLAADDPACVEPELCEFNEALEADDPACVEAEVTLADPTEPTDPGQPTETDSSSTGTEVPPR